MCPSRQSIELLCSAQGAGMGRVPAFVCVCACERGRESFVLRVGDITI